MDTKALFVGTILVVVLVSVGLFGLGPAEPEGDLLAAAAAFDRGGYDRSARIYNGTGGEWCTALGYPGDCLGFYSTGSLLFAWNAEWEQGVREAWVRDAYDARLVVLFAGERYAVTWVGPCQEGEEADGVCVWGEFRAKGELGASPLEGAGRAWFSTASPERF